MKIFITGATGFTGSCVVPLLLRNGFEVRCLYRASSDRSPLNGLEVEWALGDVSLVRKLLSLVFVFTYYNILICFQLPSRWGERGTGEVLRVAD